MTVQDKSPPLYNHGGEETQFLPQKTNIINNKHDWWTVLDPSI